MRAYTFIAIAFIAVAGLLFIGVGNGLARAGSDYCPATERPEREPDKPVAVEDVGQTDPLEMACEFPCRATDPESPLPEDAEEWAGRSDLFADDAIKLACQGTYCP